MSYILQALKKSEQERDLAAQDADVSNKSSAISVSLNRQSDGFIADSSVNSQSEKSIPMVIYGWLGVLCILILLIAGYLYPKATPQQAEPLGVTSMGISESVAPDVAEEIEVKKVPVQKIIVQKATVQEAKSKRSITEQLPQLITPKIAVELAAKNTQSLIPNINISSHIFSSLPARRSIVVNGERLAETDFITPNVQVKEITHKGMIIEVDGLSLVIDRSRGWSR
ncbi:MAG: general secretion pathway protein B [Oleispira sp.]|jgi:general secretion pathway protein B